MTATEKTVAVLHPGEMGSAVAALLTARGFRVVTTLAGRGEKTMGRCATAGIQVLPTLQDVVEVSEAVISLVLPSAAQDLASAYCRLAHLAPSGAIFIDLNSIGPDAIDCMAHGFTRRRLAFVDGAINGLAKNLTGGATLFLSGPRAASVAELFGTSMQVQVLGTEIGRASAMKMMLSGLSKGLCALFMEIAVSAERRQMLPALLDAAGKIYPGVMTIVDRMLPTYPDHAGRRANEMRESATTIGSSYRDAEVILAVAAKHERIANVNFVKDGDRKWTVKSFIDRLAKINPDDLMEFQMKSEFDPTRLSQH